MNEEAGLRINASQKIEMGKRMRQLRESVKLPQTVMAEKAHSTQSTIAKVEAGTASPSLGLLLWYAEYFDVSLDYLLGVTGIPFRCAKRENIFCFLRIFRKTPIRSCPVLSNT